MGCGASAGDKYGKKDSIEVVEAGDKLDLGSPEHVEARREGKQTGKLSTIKGNEALNKERKSLAPPPLEDSLMTTMTPVQDAFKMQDGLAWEDKKYSLSHLPARGVVEPCGFNIEKGAWVEVMVGKYINQTAFVLRDADKIGTVSLRFEGGEEVDYINTKYCRVKGAVPPNDALDLSYGPCFGPEDFDQRMLRRWSLDPESVRPGQKLDNTESAILYVGEFQSNSKKTRVVIKRINRKTTKQPFQMHVNEVRVLGRLSHPCLVKMYGIIANATRLDMVLEFCEDDDIRKCVQKNRVVPFPCLLCDVVCGLSYMHGELFAHLDVKPDNVLVTKNGQCGKLCDFGTTTRLGIYRTLKGQIGTPGYRAPEVEQGLEFDAMLADTWSFGRVTEYVACHDGRLDIRELIDARHQLPGKRTPLMRCLDIMKVIDGGAMPNRPWSPLRVSPKLLSNTPKENKVKALAFDSKPYVLNDLYEGIA